MKINYTYKEADRPIEKAEFKSSDGDKVVIELTGDVLSSDSKYVIALWITSCSLGKDTYSRFNSSDFADFTALVNRINKQIGNCDLKTGKEEKPNCSDCKHVGVNRHIEPCKNCIALIQLSSEKRDRNNFEPAI